jgi:hypothetical protein
MQLSVVRRRLTVATLTATALIATLGLAAPAAHAEPESEAPCLPIDPAWSLPSHDVVGVNGSTAPFGVDSSFGLHWSVVATVGRRYNSDIALNLAPANVCNMLAVSADPNPLRVDWIAVDDVRRSTSRYVAQPFADMSEPWWSGYSVQFVEGQDQRLATWLPNTPQTIGWKTDWMVDVRSVELQHGNTYALTIDGYVRDVYLLRSDAGDPETFTRTAATATLIAEKPGSAPVTGLVRVDQDGYYGLLFVRGIVDGGVIPILDGDRPVTVTVQTIPDCAPSAGCNIPKP